METLWLTIGFLGFLAATVFFLFLILDFLAKIGFGFLLLTNRRALGEAAGGGGQAQASRVG